MLGVQVALILCEASGLVSGEVRETNVFEGRTSPAVSIPQRTGGGGSTAELMGAGLAGSGRGLSEIGRPRRYRRHYRRFHCPACRGTFSSMVRFYFHRCSLLPKGRSWDKA